MFQDSLHSRTSDRPRLAPARGKRRTVMSAIRQLPDFLRLLYGLLTDARVSPLDKVLVGAAVAYVVTPIGIIPDFIPLIGEVDELFVLVLAIRHLINHAGVDVVLDHWEGDPEELADLNLESILAAAAFFLPRGIRRRLRTIGRL